MHTPRRPNAAAEAAAGRVGRQRGREELVLGREAAGAPLLASVGAVGASAPPVAFEFDRGEPVTRLET